jgi:Domain of unknown function (DUF4407)
MSMTDLLKLFTELKQLISWFHIQLENLSPFYSIAVVAVLKTLVTFLLPVLVVVLLIAFRQKIYTGGKWISSKTVELLTWLWNPLNAALVEFWTVDRAKKFVQAILSSRWWAKRAFVLFSSNALADPIKLARATAYSRGVEVRLGVMLFAVPMLLIFMLAETSTGFWAKSVSDDKWWPSILIAGVLYFIIWSVDGIIAGDGHDLLKKNPSNPLKTSIDITSLFRLFVRLIFSFAVSMVVGHSFILSYFAPSYIDELRNDKKAAVNLEISQIKIVQDELSKRRENLAELIKNGEQLAIDKSVIASGGSLCAKDKIEEEFKRLDQLTNLESKRVRCDFLCKKRIEDRNKFADSCKTANTNSSAVIYQRSSAYKALKDEGDINWSTYLLNQNRIQELQKLIPEIDGYSAQKFGPLKQFQAFEKIKGKGGESFIFGVFLLFFMLEGLIVLVKIGLRTKYREEEFK